MKLISMTDFVLEQNTNQTSVRRLSQIVGYAQFLEQTLTLDMFIGDKALFKGFYLDEDGYITFNDVFIYEVDKLKLYTIEDMLSEVYLSDQDINLTPKAIKHLGA